jgi:hypothetical protein
MKIKLTETKLPHGGVRKYNPKYRDMSIEEIENYEQDDLKSYSDVGYNSFTFHRATGTISIQRIKVKTLDDIFMTDIYGLLN